MKPTHKGFLELRGGKDGRLRGLDGTLLSTPSDPVVPANMVRNMDLRPGLELEVDLGSRMGGNGQNNKQQNGDHRRSKNKKNKKVKATAIDPQARRVDQILSINGQEPSAYANHRRFEDLTTIDPQPRMNLEYPGCPPACRLIDLFCPIGYGTRGLIVSPPKAGKTTLLQNIAFAISKNHPEVEVFALLVDERPEEVTDFRRNVPCHVLASSNDHDVEQHVGLAMLAIERAKRMVEAGRDVVVLLDSLTRLGRAFNNAPQLVNSGRTLTGGVDSGALAIPKQLFGAARLFEEGGSLTTLATALVDTGSRGDQVIFEEFKGTGNMELILDRKVSDQRVFPAINLAASGTRKEDLLMSGNELQTMSALRRRLFNMRPVQQVEQLLKALERFKTNDELVGSRQPQATT